MRPLSLPKSATSTARPRPLRNARKFVCLLAALNAGIILQGCSQGRDATVSLSPPTPPPPPPLIQVSVNPPSGSVTLGNAQAFMATVTGTSNSAVNWSVNGLSGGSAASGTITATGEYTAPADLPSPASVRVTATSDADPAKSATASITILSDIVVQIAPNIAGVELGALQPFSASV